MTIALTGATGFLGHYLVRHLAEAGHDLHCLTRPTSDRSGFDDVGRVEWVTGSLREPESFRDLVAGCETVVHAALDRPGAGFRGAEGDLVPFVETNLVGTLRLIEAARSAGVRRFIFISTCAVHEKILAGRPLDETHPTWATSHYGAHKAAIEQFIYSYGLGDNYPICSLRPCGIYGLARPARMSKWFDLVRQVVRGGTVSCRRGGKEVHAADVSRAAELLMKAPADQIAGEAFNCCDRYVSDHEVATLAKEISGSDATIHGEPTTPKNTIETGKLRNLGMNFDSDQRLRDTISQLVDAARSE